MRSLRTLAIPGTVVPSEQADGSPTGHEVSHSAGSDPNNGTTTWESPPTHPDRHHDHGCHTPFVALGYGISRGVRPPDRRLNRRRARRSLRARRRSDPTASDRGGAGQLQPLPEPAAGARRRDRRARDRARCRRPRGRGPGRPGHHSHQTRIQAAGQARQGRQCEPGPEHRPGRRRADSGGSRCHRRRCRPVRRGGRL